MNFERFPIKVYVETLLEQIEAHPELWNLYSERKESPDSPHQAMSDIWLRYRAKDELLTPDDYKGPHIPVWYPARRDLPAVENIALALMTYFRAVQLGGVLITKIPPGGKILPHNDRGTWHPEFFNCKIYVPLKSNDKCFNECEGDRVSMQAGEVWHFDNLKEHSVENNSDEDRITLIICMRTEP